MPALIKAIDHIGIQLLIKMDVLKDYKEAELIAAKVKDNNIIWNTARLPEKARFLQVTSRRKFSKTIKSVLLVFLFVVPWWYGVYSILGYIF